MTLITPTLAAPALADAVRAKLQGQEPLTLAQITKGLPKPKKAKAAEVEAQVRPALEDEVRSGRAFRHPSGKNGVERFWARDEKQALRDEAVRLAATPQTLSALTKALGKTVKGVGPAFVETVVRELIGEDRLFEHPPKTKAGGPLFGTTPPPPKAPPLQQPKHKKALDGIAKSCRKLLDAAKVPAEELFRALREALAGPTTSGVEAQAATAGAQAPPQSRAPGGPNPELEALILKAVANAPVLSLADLRGDLPPEFQGPAFDETVLRLADEQRVILTQDASPARFSDAERARHVRDESGGLFVTISRRS
jgi:hypothetical protein